MLHRDKRAAFWGQEQLEGVSHEHRGQGAACEVNAQMPIPPSVSTLEREATKSSLASLGGVKEMWLHGGTSALENQGHLSSGAAVEVIAETRAAHGHPLYCGTIQSFGGSDPCTESTMRASSFQCDL